MGGGRWFLEWENGKELRRAGRYAHDPVDPEFIKT